MNTETTQASLPTEPRGLLDWLRQTYPTFGDCKPLALRIDAEIAKRHPELARKALRTALRIHVNSTRYLKAIEKGRERFDLDGAVAGEITDEQRAHAAQTLKQRFAEAVRAKREKEAQARAAEKAAEAERRRSEKLQQLVGKFSRG